MGDRGELLPHNEAASPAAPTSLTTCVINAILEMPNRVLWRRLNPDKQEKNTANVKVVLL